MASAIQWDLFRRIKAVEKPGGTWPPGDVLDVLIDWFHEHGVDVDDPADEVFTYRLNVAVELDCPWALDPADLTSAVAQAITGIAVRVEHEEIAEMSWCELLVTGVEDLPRT